MLERTGAGSRAAIDICNPATRVIPGGGPWRRAPPSPRREPTWLRCPGEGCHRMHRQDHRGPWRLREVEVRGQVAQDADVLAHRGPRVGTAVGERIDALSIEEHVLDELVVGVEAEGLVVYIALAGVGADPHAGHAQPVSVLVDDGGDHVIVEAAPVVPGEEDGG